MSFPIFNRYAICGTVSLLSIVFALVYAQGGEALWKLGQVVLSFLALGLAVGALGLLQTLAEANKTSIVRFVDRYAKAIMVSGSVLIAGIVSLGWYLASVSIIGKRTAPIVSFDQAMIFLLTSTIAGFCLASFMVRDEAAETKRFSRITGGTIATAFISFLLFTIVALGGT